MSKAVLVSCSGLGQVMSEYEICMQWLLNGLGRQRDVRKFLTVLVSRVNNAETAKKIALIFWTGLLSAEFVYIRSDCSCEEVKCDVGKFADALTWILRRLLPNLFMDFCCPKCRNRQCMTKASKQTVVISRSIKQFSHCCYFQFCLYSISGVTHNKWWSKLTQKYNRYNQWHYFWLLCMDDLADAVRWWCW